MTTLRPWRVLIVDDHAILRDGLRRMIEAAGAEFAVAGEASSGEEGLRLAETLKPDLILLDIGMPGLGGMEVARRLRTKAQRVRIVILSQHNDSEYVVEGFRESDIAGYVLKDDDPKVLLDAMRAVRGGRRFISPSIAPALIGELRRKNRPARTAVLTPREREVLKLIGEGAMSKTIAHGLGISPKTVQIHRSNIAAKLGLKGTAEMVRYAIRHKLVRM